MRVFLALVLIAVLAGCTDQPRVYKNTFAVAGTYLEVSSPYKQAARIVEAEFTRLSKLFDDYDETSEVSRINQSYRTNLTVSPEMIELLQLSRKYHNMTAGLFDVSCGSLYRFWKDEIARGNVTSLPPPGPVIAAKATCGMGYIVVDPRERTVRITNKGLRIDLGAIAKGYMVDKAVEKLRQNNIDSCLISAGGQIYALGKNGDKPWRVGIRDPKNKNQIAASRDLVDQAMATSGGYEQFFEINGKRYSHIIDPRSGYPAISELQSVTIIAESGALADALATACYAIGPIHIPEFLHRAGNAQAVVIRDKEGKQVIEEFGNAQTAR